MGSIYLFKNCLLLLCARGTSWGLDTHCVSVVQTSSSGLSQHSWSCGRCGITPGSGTLLLSERKRSKLRAFGWTLLSKGARKVALASWGEEEGSLEQMWTWYWSVTWGCLSSKGRGDLCPLESGARSTVQAVKQGFEWITIVSNAWNCKVPGHMEVWRKGRLGTSGVWDSEGKQKMGLQDQGTECEGLRQVGRGCAWRRDLSKCTATWTVATSFP